MSSVLTYSALNAFRNCPRKYKHRYIDRLRPMERAEALAFGSVIHEALEKWYSLPADMHRLLTVLALLDEDQGFPNHQADPQQKAKCGPKLDGHTRAGGLVAKRLNRERYKPIIPGDEDEILYARRLIAQRCLCRQGPETRLRR